MTFYFLFLFFFFWKIECQNKFKERQPLYNFFLEGEGGEAWIINISPRKFILTSTSVYIPSSPLFFVFQVQFFRSSPRTNTNKICLSGRVSRVSYRDKLLLFASCNFSCFLFMGKFSLSFIPVHYFYVCICFFNFTCVYSISILHLSLELFLIKQDLLKSLFRYFSKHGTKKSQNRIAPAAPFVIDVSTFC